MAALRAWWYRSGFGRTLEQAGFRLQLTPRDVATLARAAVRWQAEIAGVAARTVEVTLAMRLAALEEGQPLFSQSAMKDVDANIRRGRKALAKAITERTSVYRAMFRNGLGWVAFVGGSEGWVMPSGKSKGLAHILEARQRKDGLTESEAIRFLDDLVDTVAKGTEFSRQEINGVVRVGIERNDAIVWLVRRPGSNAWIVTVYEKNPVGRAAGRAAARPTHVAASPTRDDMGAGFADSLAK